MVPNSVATIDLQLPALHSNQRFELFSSFFGFFFLFLSRIAGITLKSFSFPSIEMTVSNRNFSLDLMNYQITSFFYLILSYFSKLCILRINIRKRITVKNLLTVREI